MTGFLSRAVRDATHDRTPGVVELEAEVDVVRKTQQVEVPERDCRNDVDDRSIREWIRHLEAADSGRALVAAVLCDREVVSGA
jgi:hypothetical protein